MSEIEQYIPGPAHVAQVRKDLGSDKDKWTLVLVKELRHSPEKVWKALTDPKHLRQWAPFDVNESLGNVGTVNLTWVGNPKAMETKITRAEVPEVLEFGDIRWELEASTTGTRLTLWHAIDRRFIAWGAAGWHISFDMLDRLLAGAPIQRIASADAMKSADWQRLVGEYSKQFGMEAPGGSPKAAQES